MTLPSSPLFVPIRPGVYFHLDAEPEWHVRQTHLDIPAILSDVGVCDTLANRRQCAFRALRHFRRFAVPGVLIAHLGGFRLQ